MILGFSNILRNSTPFYYVDLPSFQRDFAALKTLDHGTGPNINFTRASNATYFDVNGALQTASNDVPRFDHDAATGSSLGLLIEEARTNSIRNSQAGGSTNGVIGSGGVAPTNWFLNAPAGITREVVATGSLSGFNYIDFRFSGTPSSNGQQIVYFDSANAAASIGQTWTTSVYAALIAGNQTNAGSLRVTVEESSGSFLVASTTNLAPISANLSRFAVTRTFNNASVTGATAYVTFNVTSGQAIDLTLRIAAPQLEQGAFPTSYIPTTSAAVTRNADSAVVNPISSFYNPSEGTLFAEYVTDKASRVVADFNDNSVNNRFALVTSSASVPRAAVVLATATQFGSEIGSAPSAGVAVRLIATAKLDDFQAARGGTLGTADTSGTPPASLTHFRIGSAGNDSGFTNGHIRKIAYWPKRLTNTLLQQLTT